MDIQSKIAELETMLNNLKSQMEINVEPPKNIVVYNNKQWMLTMRCLDYNDTVEYARSVGDGWRVPRVHELLSLYDFEKDTTHIKFGACRHADIHWSATGQTVSLYAGVLYKNAAWRKSYYALLVRDSE